MSTVPTLTITDEDGDSLSVWPAVAGQPPAIQIDSGKRSLAVELTPETAEKLCSAIKAALG